MAQSITTAAPPHMYQRVYVWELPVRLYHWVNAACIVILAASGFVIGNPPSLNASYEAYAGYWFGHLPELHLYTISVETLKPMCLELSPAVAAAVPEVVHTVHAHAARLAAPV